MTRREFVGRAAWSATVPSISGCSMSGDGDAQYASTVRSLRRPLSRDSQGLFHDLVRCATLAANGHNTQPWKFQQVPGGIDINPDFSRRTPAVDPDDHHLWVSLGCAIENLVVAAEALGKRADVELTPTGSRVVLANGAVAHSLLADAIFQRQCTRAPYDGLALSIDALKSLEQAAAHKDVQLLLLTDRAKIESVLAFVTQGNSAQMDDPAFVAELKHWIRFNESQAMSSGDGLFTRSTGNPALPPWLGRRLFSVFFSRTAENDKYAKHLRSSAGVAILIGERSDPACWIEVGRTYQRLALLLTTMGVRNALINQAVEVPAVRHQFAQWLGLNGRRPDLVFRFGRGSLLPYSLRRPVAQVIELAAPT